MKTAAEIMAGDGPSVHPSDDARTAIDLLSKSDLGAIPVVDNDNKLVGIVSESDLILSEEESDLHLPHYIELFGGVVFLESTKKFEERLRKAIGFVASDVMTEDPVTIQPDATVAEAAREIARHKHNRLPVVEHGRLVGVVTRVDVLDALVSE